MSGGDDLAMRLVVWLAPLLLAFFAAEALAQAAVAIPGGGGPSIVFDPVHRRAYVADDSDGIISVVEGRDRITTVRVGRGPKWVAVNPATNRIYASNSGDGTLSVIDGATLAVTSLAIGGAGPLAVNVATNTVAVLRLGTPSEVTLVSGETNQWLTVNTGGTQPALMALNPATGKLYVTNGGTHDVRVVDLSNPWAPAASIPIPGRIGPLAVDSRRNRVYVASDGTGTSITAIDGATNATQAIALPGHGGVPLSIAVNEGTNRVYAGFMNDAAVIDGATGGVLSYVVTYNGLYSLTADPTNGRVYGLQGTGALTAIDGTGYAWSTGLSRGGAAAIGFQSIAVDTSSQLLYVAGFDGMSVIDAVHGYAPAPVSYQGMWWAFPANSESGWGIDFAHQGNVVFGAFFTYGASGEAQWFVLPRLDWNAGGEFAGGAYRVTGPSYTNAAFDPSKVAPSAMGFAWVRFVGTSDAFLTAVLDGRRFSRHLTRQVFGPLPTCVSGASPAAQPNYTDIWWNSPAGSEAGWGLFVTHQGDNAFAVWFTYDTDGHAVWFAGNAVKSGDHVFSGTFYRTTGAPYTVDPWPSGNTVANPVGSLTLAFSDANNGSFTYEVSGTRGFKAIAREAFSTPATACR